MVAVLVLAFVLGLVTIFSVHILSRRSRYLDANRLLHVYFVLYIFSSVYLYTYSEQVKVWQLAVWGLIFGSVIWYAALVQAGKDLEEENQPT